MMKCLIDKINGKPGEYEKDFMKIRFALDDSLSLNKTLKILYVTIVVRSTFKEEDKYYLQILLDECFHEL